LPGITRKETGAVSQPAISKPLKALRALLAASLFGRGKSGRGGRAIKAFADRTLSRLAN